jgi:DNA-binding NarL/FixJ family response regulator
MSRPSKLRLILADDHPVLREGLSLILGTLPDIAVVAQSSTGEEAFELFLKLEPDVLILDLQMPGEGGEHRKATSEKAAWRQDCDPDRLRHG